MVKKVVAKNVKDKVIFIDTMLQKYIFLNQISAATALVEGKLGKGLKKILKKVVAKDAQAELAVADAKLGSMIKVSFFWDY